MQLQSRLTAITHMSPTIAQEPYPLRDGYEDVASFGTWYGSQMDYAPFGQARIRAEQMADQMNEKGF